MEFSAVVLMERDKETKFFLRELGSYEINEGAEYITKLFYEGDKVYMYFDTNKDVEDWEFTAIYENFDEDSFKDIVTSIEPYDEEYNPTWILTFDYDEDHQSFKEKLELICSVISLNMNKVFEHINNMGNQCK